MHHHFRSVVLALGVAMLAAGCGTLAQRLQIGGPGKVSQLASVVGPKALPATTNNHLKLFADRDAFPQLERLLQSATRSIFIETFEWDDDVTGRAIADLLIAKHQQGVDVKVLIDGIGQQNPPTEIPARLLEHGVTTARYGPFPFWRASGKGLNLTHRKLYLVDGTSGMTGGMNIGDDYADKVHDMLWRIDGDAVGQLCGEFAAEWRRANAPGTIAIPPEASASYGSEPIAIAVTSPREPGREHEIHDTLIAAVDHASRRIDLSYPYFWDDALLAHLSAAASRSVAVHVILTTHDKGVGADLNKWAAAKLRPRGIDFHWYDRSYAHIKYAAIDDDFLLVGSSNADDLTFDNNQELDLVLSNPATVADFRSRISDPDWASTPEVQAADLHIPALQKPIYDLLEFLRGYM